MSIYSRGIPPSVVENAIKFGEKTSQGIDRVVHTYENITVVTNDAADTVITVIGKGVSGQ